MSVLKTTVEKWHIRRPNGWWCGNFLFDNNNGEICIHSDWGNWAYRWGSMGEGIDLKAFLIGCDTGYLMSKFSHPNERSWFDKDETIKELKKKIIKLRRDNDLDDDIARLHWDELDDFNDIEGGDAYWIKFYETEHLKEMYYDHYDIPYVTDYHPRLRAFMRIGWPIFTNAIREEMGLEQRAQDE